VVEAVFAGDELAAFEGAQDEEGVAAAQDAGALELGGDGAGSGAGGDVDVDGVVVGGAGGRADGSVDKVGREGGAEEREQQEGREKLQAGPFVSQNRGSRSAVG
jgi:hypothetical protein